MKGYVFHRTGATAALALCLLVGCGKKEETSSTPSPTADVSQGATQDQSAQPNPVPTGPTAADLAAQQAAMERLRQAELAAKQRDYEKAVEAMLAIQQQQRILSEQQAQMYYQRMQQLQADLASAIAAGDPRARAAAERLRRASTPR